MKLRRLILEDNEKLIKVKSLRPWIDRSYGRRAICWPIMLVEARGSRMTVAPIWNLERLKRAFQREGE